MACDAGITSCPTFLAALGAGLSVLLSAIGAGIGIGISGPAIAGAGVERPEVMFKTFIATILAEALAIYGLVVGLLSVFAITPTLTLEGSARIFAGGLTMGAAALGAGFGIGTSGSAMASATAEKPDIFSRAVISLILAEALAIYALVTALLLVLQAK
ncbi:MAG TPA: V-type ATP synthase subunit K [Candidatus Bathyarchaeia archaeon]|nr:V-type ATP synthase subunit K [Candidatus Bathyarchaeia archaeon]